MSAYCEMSSSLSPVKISRERVAPAAAPMNQACVAGGSPSQPVGPTGAPMPQASARRGATSIEPISTAIAAA
jgi:hypothetical protein